MLARPAWITACLSSAASDGACVQHPVWLPLVSPLRRSRSQGNELNCWGAPATPSSVFPQRLRTPLASLALGRASAAAGWFSSLSRRNAGGSGILVVTGALGLEKAREGLQGARHARWGKLGTLWWPHRRCGTGHVLGREQSLCKCPAPQRGDLKLVLSMETPERLWRAGEPSKSVRYGWECSPWAVAGETARCSVLSGIF